MNPKTYRPRLDGAVQAVWSKSKQFTVSQYSTHPSTFFVMTQSAVRPNGCYESITVCDKLHEYIKGLF